MSAPGQMRVSVGRGIKPALRRWLEKRPLGREFLRLQADTRLKCLQIIHGRQYQAAVFNRIWKQNLWADEESRSGSGSNLLQTTVLREELPKILADLSIGSMLDIPCGDFHWMKTLAFPSGFVYIGGDIVEQIVDANSRQFGDEIRSFRHIDLLRDKLPPADLLLCRDCLVHFSLADIYRALANFKRSEAKYLLTTHYSGERPHADIITGQWRPINLTMPPFRFPSPRLLINERYSGQGGLYTDKCLALWDIKDIPDF